jgi:hypothetical protein
VLRLDPKQKTAATAIAECKALDKAMRDQQREAFKGMFDKAKK